MDSPCIGKYRKAGTPRPLSVLRFALAFDLLVVTPSGSLAGGSDAGADSRALERSSPSLLIAPCIKRGLRPAPSPEQRLLRILSRALAVHFGGERPHERANRAPLHSNVRQRFQVELPAALPRDRRVDFIADNGTGKKSKITAVTDSVTRFISPGGRAVASEKQATEVVPPGPPRPNLPPNGHSEQPGGGAWQVQGAVQMCGSCVTRLQREGPLFCLSSVSCGWPVGCWKATVAHLVSGRVKEADPDGRLWSPAQKHQPLAAASLWPVCGPGCQELGAGSRQPQGGQPGGLSPVTEESTAAPSRRALSPPVPPDRARQGAEQVSRSFTL